MGTLTTLLKTIGFCLLLVLSTQILAADKAAKVIIIRGKVTAVDSTGKNVPLKKGTWVSEGTSIKSQAKSFVKFLFIDKSQMNLGPNSEMIISKFPKKKAGIITLMKGQLRSKVTKNYMEMKNKDQSKLFIKTKTAAMGVRGTDFQVSFSAAQATELVTFSGAVAMVKIDEITGNNLDIGQNALEQMVSSPEAVMVTKGEVSTTSTAATTAAAPAKVPVATLEKMKSNPALAPLANGELKAEAKKMDKEAAPKKEAPKKDEAPKKKEAPKKADAPKKEAPKKGDAPKKAEAPKKGDAPKKAEAPKKVADAPKKAPPPSAAKPAAPAAAKPAAPVAAKPLAVAPAAPKPESGEKPPAPPPEAPKPATVAEADKAPAPVDAPPPPPVMAPLPPGLSADMAVNTNESLNTMTDAPLPELAPPPPVVEFEPIREPASIEDPIVMQDTTLPPPEDGAPPPEDMPPPPEDMTMTDEPMMEEEYVSAETILEDAGISEEEVVNDIEAEVEEAVETIESTSTNVNFIFQSQ